MSQDWHQTQTQRSLTQSLWDDAPAEFGAPWRANQMGHVLQG